MALTMTLLAHLTCLLPGQQEDSPLTQVLKNKNSNVCFSNKHMKYIGLCSLISYHLYNMEHLSNSIAVLLFKQHFVFNLKFNGTSVVF